MAPEKVSVGGAAGAEGRPRPPGRFGGMGNAVVGRWSVEYLHGGRDKEAGYRRWSVMDVSR